MVRDRQAEFGGRSSAVPRSPEETSALEARNAARQMNYMLSVVQESGSGFELTAELIKEFHRIALDGLDEEAGRFRRRPVTINDSRHVPPRFLDVEPLVQEMCDFSNRHLHEYSEGDILHIPAYLLWRLPWIHPFSEGNGRTARIISYLVLCVSQQRIPPGVRMIPELILDHRDEYYASLESADRKWAETDDPHLAVRNLEQFLSDRFVEQIQSAAGS